jgi:tetratricopeptide (TPR) repeat protein
MKASVCVQAVTALVFASVLPNLFGASDSSIDKIFKKLPPPEKLVKRRVEHAVKQTDSAFDDPLSKRIFAADAADNFPTALALSRQLVQRNRNSPFAHFLVGVYAFDTTRFVEASGAFRAAIALRSDLGILHLLLGASEMIQRHYAGALPHLEQSEKLEPTWAAGWILASQCAAELGHRQESLNFARRSTAAEPAWLYTWLQLARAERSVGHSQEMLHALGQAAQLDPDDGEMFAAIGFSYINLDRIQEAIPPLQRAARLLPRDYLVVSQLGFCLQAVGRVDAGISYLRKGASLNSKYGPVWEHLGLAYEKKGDHREAVNAFERAARLLPKSPRPWMHLASEYRLLGRTADADQAARRAQRLGGIAPKQGETKKRRH